MLVTIIRGSEDGLLTYVNRVDTIVRVVLNRSSESKTDVVAFKLGGFLWVAGLMIAEALWLRKDKRPYFFAEKVYLYLRTSSRRIISSQPDSNVFSTVEQARNPLDRQITIRLLYSTFIFFSLIYMIRKL